MTKLITVSREFGSGGRTIAKAVAERLGIPYYDKELIKAVAEKTGFDPQYIEETGEYAPGKTMLSLMPYFNGTMNTMSGLSASDFLWIMQRQVILELADKGPCVIVGRCADYILSRRENCLHAFIYADKEARAKRIVELYGQGDKSPRQRLDDKDKRRAVNYKYYTGRDWGKSQNYDICLNSGCLGIETCIDILTKLGENG